MMNETTAATRAPWRFEQSWTAARNFLVCAMIVLIFHEFLVRVFGTVYMPAVTGFSLSAIYFVEGSALALMALGLWRCIADPPYRQRFRPAFVYMLVAWTFVCIAFLSLNVTSIGGALTVRSLLYAPYLFFLGYLVGVDRWLVYKNLLVAGLVKFALTVVLGLLFF